MSDAKTTEPAPPFVYTTKSDEAIRQLVIDWLAGCITSDRNLPKGTDLGIVFMAFGFMVPSAAKAMLAVLGPKAMIYEHISKAGPRSINGQPSFTSFHYLDSADFDRFVVVFKELGGKTT